jgi:TolB-like protein/tetratricopeptide (TPR) repeat protein
MPEPSNAGATPVGAQARERRLESWKEIAVYLRREIRTVQRWENTLGLPIHRLQVGKQSSVYAYPSELDKWYHEREPHDIKDDDEVEPLSATAGNPNLPSVPSAPPIDSVEIRPHSKVPFFKKKFTWLAAIALLVIVGILSLSVFWVPSVSIQPRGGVSADTKIRLFVRPFQNIAGDPGQSEFTEGLTDEINSQLGKLDPQRLGVIAPTSSKQFASRPIGDLESLLKVQYVLEGKVRRANDKVSIDVFLISAKDQTQVFADSFTENLTDVLKAQDEVAATVARKILLNLPASKPTVFAASVDPEGYAFYLRGRRSWSVRDLSRSVPAFEGAVARLPNYSLAHSGLAASYAVMGEGPNNAVPSTVSAPKARAEARRALDLDANSAEAHCVLGNLAMSFDFDFPAAERELRQAVSLEPNNATAHQWLGQYFMTQNRIAEAQAETLKALELDPVSAMFTTTREEAYYYARDFDSTIAQANLTLEQSPKFLLGEFWLASAYREKKMYPEALQHFRVASSQAPENPAILMALGHALAVSGDRQGALGVLAQLQGMSHQRYVPSLYMAGIYLGLGDKDNVFVYMNRAVAEHNDRLIYLAVEPLADPLRADPRFQTLLAHIHLDNLKH